MATTHRGRHVAGRSHRPVAEIVIQALTGMTIGAMPGVILVLLAQFVIEGEMQLTVGAPGILLAIAGGLAGLIIATVRAIRRTA